MIAAVPVVQMVVVFNVGAPSHMIGGYESPPKALNFDPKWGLHLSFGQLRKVAGQLFWTTTTQERFARDRGSLESHGCPGSLLGDGDACTACKTFSIF